VKARLLAPALACSVAACAAANEPPTLPRPTVTVAAADAAEAADASAPVRFQVLAISDFHGHLEPPVGSDALVTVPPDDPFLREHPGAGARQAADGKDFVVAAGGVAYLRAHIERLRRENPNTWVVSAGDLTGGSPLVSNLFKDEPSVLAMNLLGLDFEGVGNHDFDRGLAELERLAHGGCSQGDCDAGLGAFIGAHFEYLAANVVRAEDPAKTVFPPYAIRDKAGVRFAFVGLTLKDTPQVTVPNAVRGLLFEDEAETLNRLVPELLAERVDQIVVLLHQGSHQAGGTYDSCENVHGSLDRILAELRPELDILITSHSHQMYDCVIPTPLGSRLVTSAGSNGRLVTRFDLTWDPDARKWLDKRAKNVIVSRDIAPDPEELKLVEEYETRAAPVMSRVVGYVHGSILRGNIGNEPRPGERRVCESPAGEFIADAQLAATHADVAFMNPGGVRSDLASRGTKDAPYALTYADAFEVQPFGNRLVTMTLTGEQIKALLSTQLSVGRLLQPSSGLAYRFVTGDGGATKIDWGSLRVADKPLDTKRRYRVTVNSFLAVGGDGFAVLKEGTSRQEGVLDVDALIAYVGQRSSRDKPLEPTPALHRISGEMCQ
jgi:5'-nucleotidase